MSVCMMVWLVGQLIRECVFENKKEVVTFANNICGAGEQQEEPIDGGGDVEMVGVDNPMNQNNVQNALQKQARKKKMQKVRKKLSIGASARNHKFRTASSGSTSKSDANPLYMGGDTTVTKHVTSVGIKTPEKLLRVPARTNQERRRSFRKIDDEECGMYFQDVDTGETMWDLPKNSEVVLEGEEERVEGGEQKSTSRRQSFRKVDDAEFGVYFQDTLSGETTWELPENGELVHVASTGI